MEVPVDMDAGCCFCGAVTFTVTGKPEVMCYCHCESCRHWSATPVTAAALWRPDAIKVTAGAEKIGTYNRTPRTFRQWCTRCGGHLFADNAGLGLIDVFPPLLKQLAFEPALHVNYAETVMPMKDGLPKFKDIPKELGGSGDMLPE